MQEIRGPLMLPATRRDIELHTSDGLTLVGDLSVPVDREPAATIIALHPLPTAGGNMDTHVMRKCAARLPAQSDLAVLRFNTRGTASPRGRSEGSFDGGVAERFDVAAAVEFIAQQGLPHPWLLGWSFGTELALKYALDHPVDGAFLLSPPLRRTSAEEVARWSGDQRRLIALVPELDDHLRPVEARERFAAVPHAEVIEVKAGTHLWVGENQTRRVLTEIVTALNPEALPLATTWAA